MNTPLIRGVSINSISEQLVYETCNKHHCVTFLQIERVSFRSDAENSPVTSEFPAQMASNAENVSI